MRVVFLLMMTLALVSAKKGVLDAIETDVALTKLKTNLPSGWQISASGDTLKIYHPDKIWSLESNFINAPEMDLRDDDICRKRIVENGKETRAEIVFLMRSLKGLSKTELQKANYASKKYALFQLSAGGFDTPYVRNYPWKIEGEAARIYSLILPQNLKSIQGPVYPEVDYSRP